MATITNFDTLLRLQQQARQAKPGTGPWFEFVQAMLDSFPGIYEKAQKMNEQAVAAKERETALLNAIQRMVSAQHAGPITQEMHAAREHAKALLPDVLMDDKLVKQASNDSTSGEADEAKRCPAGFVHRGYMHFRTNYDTARFRSNLREQVLARAWERENTLSGKKPHICSLASNKGLLDSLMTTERIEMIGNSGFPRQERTGTYDQNSAAVAATVVQWLGSNVGFSWLCETLSEAGYEVVDRTRAAV